MEITDFQIEFDTYSRSFKSILFFGKMEYLENEKSKEKSNVIELKNYRK